MFRVGNTVVCINAIGYDFTTNKEYTILEYIPELHDDSVANGFTWPAYVEVRDNSGHQVRCHAHRFKHKE